MNIDWEKQPEGFPLWLEGTNEDHRKHSGWYRSAGQVFEGAHGGQWRAVREGQFFTVHHKPESTEWNGEGLPPVGVVCELRAHKLTDWSMAKIEFAFRNVIVWDWIGEPSMNGLCTAYAHAVEIRPIRTPEQIAAEEREGAIHEMVDHLKRWHTVQDLCGDLYDAGYRKQVKP